MVSTRAEAVERPCNQGTPPGAGARPPAEPFFVPPILIAPFGLTDVGTDSVPTFVDIDDDGDLDAFIGEAFGETYYFENTGTITNPAFADPITDPFGLTDVISRSAPAFADIDNDGDLDAFIGEDDGETFYFENVTVTSEGLTLELTPLGSLDIPPEGGFIELDLTLTNETEETREVDFWVTIVNTDAGIDRTRNPLPITLAPGQTKTHTLTQQVPGVAPSGDYTYSAFVGAFPDDVAASDSFVFTKEAGAPKVATASGLDWSLTLEEAAKTSTEQPFEGSFTLAQNFPNPFTRATEIRFSVASAGPVTVAVYDLTGRRVTTLFEGEAGRPYALRFDAEGLAAGVYLYELRQGARRQMLTMMLVK